MNLDLGSINPSLNVAQILNKMAALNKMGLRVGSPMPPTIDFWGIVFVISKAHRDTGWVLVVGHPHTHFF